MESAIKEGLPTERIKELHRGHLRFVQRERLEYKKKRDKEKLQPYKYLSIIIDGADQSGFGLPQFTTSTKASRGHSLKVKFIGILEHGLPNRLHLFTMTEEFETGANHIIEALPRFSISRKQRSRIPKQLFIQVDNCTRENKNKVFMAFNEAMIR